MLWISFNNSQWKERVSILLVQSGQKDLGMTEAKEGREIPGEEFVSFGEEQRQFMTKKSLKML